MRKKTDKAKKLEKYNQTCIHTNIYIYISHQYMNIYGVQSSTIPICLKVRQENKMISKISYKCVRVRTCACGEPLPIKYDQ